ncbi:hypothetical protein I4U23_022575 [Adineta vaga]|nr:hypothetical protein I4U23_022575 [Adineta vaga]
MRWKNLFQFIKRTLIKHNLFQTVPPSTDETILRHQRYQTRLYLFLLFTVLIILTIYVPFETKTITDTSDSISITTFNQLTDQHPFTLNCPCSQTSLEYNQFISDIKVEYHEICSSEFISSRWIDLQFIQSPVREFLINDVRYQSQMHFQLLSTLCRVAKQTINDNLQSFNRTKFITHQVLTSTNFQTETNLIIEQFKTTIAESYKWTLQLIQANPEINQFVVPLNSKIQVKRDIYGYEVFRLKPAENAKYDEHYCVFQNIPCACFYLFPNECVLQTTIPKDAFTKIIPGMIQTTFPLRSVLLSTLQCFYNETCLSYIINEINSLVSPTNFSTLNRSSLSMADSVNDPIEKLASELFIRSWHNQSSYESYFNQCHPLTCQYTYVSQFTIMDIVIAIIGVLGSLNLVLLLSVPCIIKLSYYIWDKISFCQENMIRPSAETIFIRTAFLDRLRILFNSFKKYIIELNLFPIIPPSQDIKILRRHQRLTRIYLTLLFISFLILAVYAIIAHETKTVTIESPSISKYLQLSKQYPLTLQCSCSNITVKYNQFITKIEPQYHPICSSDFVLSVKNGTGWDTIFVNDDDADFRFWIKSQLEIVLKMCSISENILNSSLSLWLQRNFITPRVISLVEFNIQIKGLIEEFKRTTVNELLLLFKLLQVTNFANQLATIRSSNWKFIINSIYNLNSCSKRELVDPQTYQNHLTALALPQKYDDENNCSCGLQSNCAQFSTLPYRVSNQSMKRILPNFLAGCSPLDSMLQSSFSCFFNETCLYLLQTSIYYVKPVPVKVLVSSSLSSSNRTVETILSQMFVEEWLENTSFDRYYEGCAPQICEYSYSLGFNGIYFITKTLAILSGLTKILRHTVSFMTLIVIKLINRKRKSQITPRSNIAVTDLDNLTLNTLQNVPITSIEVIFLLFIVIN